MSLPNGFKNSYEYFYQANEFLKKYSWIYKEANTEFLKAGILNKMPQEFQHYFIEIEIKELNEFPCVEETLINLHTKAFKEFRQELAKLIPSTAYKEAKDIEKPIKLKNLQKMNVKKQHEIQRLAAVVEEHLKIKQNVDRQNCVLIDFGSGLGYLSESLYRLDNSHLILGLEADTYRVKAAKKRIHTYIPTAINSIQYRQHFITENSKDFIVKTVEEVFKFNYQHAAQQTTTKMAIIGLHACADLTITSMKLFLQLPQAKHLIIMPCCYHKLQVCDDVAAANTSRGNFKFKHFPLSKSLKQVILGNTGNRNDSANYAATNSKAFTTYLNRPFLRLACQQTLKRWSKCSSLEHQAHGIEMFLRGIAELLKVEEEQQFELVVVKRKTERIDFSSLTVEQSQCFDTFKRLFVLKRRTTNEFVEWSERHMEKFSKIMKKYPHGAKLAEGLTCLQTSMQKLCENLVLYDRLCFMEETALEMNLKISVRYEKIMDEELSPRCYVLIAEKL